MNICFIGFGNMAKAIAQALCKSGNNLQIFANSPSLPTGKTAEGIITHPNNLANLAQANLVILAVKPAKMAAVLAEIREELPKGCLLISVAAGLNLNWLEQHCQRGQAIIRSMPNIALAVGQGATPLIANQHVSKEQKHWAEQIFQSAGLIAWTNKESDIDGFNALSGSGPAYVFLFLEAMTKAAIKLGLDEKIAERFALQTAKGAIELATQSKLPMGELRKKVSSPAGTTAAAIDILQQRGFEELLFQAMKAAYERAKQLGASYESEPK